MTTEKWERLTRLFADAVELPQEERAAWATEKCAGDPEFLAELLKLLAIHEEQTGPLDHPFPNIRQAPEPRRTFEDGEVILDRFRVARFIKGGGMGDVFEAWDLELNERIALKTIRPEIAADPAVLARFRSEIQLARRVANPNVCRIHDLFVAPRREHRGPAHFLTMEFLDGPTLADHIRRNGPLPLEEVKRLVPQMCAGLNAAHKAQIVHRDFKSSNVILVPSDEGVRAVITDFGLARETKEAAQEAETASFATRPGTVIGTYPYMAPEQFGGICVSAATDVYALGIVIYEMLTGTLPFPGNTPTAAAIQRAKAPAKVRSLRPGLPAFWDEAIAHCLKYEQEDRFQSAMQVAAALAESRSTAGNLRQKIRSIPGRGWIAAVSPLVIALCAAIVWLVHPFGYRPPSAEAQRWYREGVAALREGTYLKATAALEHATSLDKKYVLAHARLADAWAELEFTGKARDEMLKASSLELVSNLPATDREYIEAIRATVTRDFSAAAATYRKILDRLGSGEKAYGYLDLGRAYEKAGNIEEAIRNYSAACQAGPEYPAAFVRLGILESRHKQIAEGDAAFASAEALYKAASNLEGQAEIDYQRGYTANNIGRLDQAVSYLEKSLNEAKAIPSVQVEVRALLQLSTTEYLRNNPDKSKELANQAIQIARDNGIEYWTADGLIRLGSAYFAARDYQAAETTYRQALRLAQENGQPRVEALASLQLASLQNQSGKPDEVLSLANVALEFYRSNGFYREAASALLLIARARRDKGEYQKALQSAKDTLVEARKAKNQPFLVQAIETYGRILMFLQEYPAALQAFREALEISRTIHQFVQYELMNCASALGELGEYSEAEGLLHEAAGMKATPPGEVERIIATIRLSQKRYGEVLSETQRMMGVRPPLTAAALAEANILRCRAFLSTGSPDRARTACEAALQPAAAKADRDLETQATLAMAWVDAYAHNARAEVLAESARAWSESFGQKESEWLSLFCLAQIAKNKDSAAAQNYASRALDILGSFEHNWGTQEYKMYMSRPDVRDALRQLRALARR